jgi:CheY-like chemotaxis protein
MPHITPFARGPERRRLARGGRRAEDLDGFAPLVLLIGTQPDVVDRSEAILAKLRFGVTTSGSVEDALRIVAELRPDIVVSDEKDAERIRLEAPQHLPVVVMDQEMRDSPEALIEEIRRTLRANPAPLAFDRPTDSSVH